MHRHRYQHTVHPNPQVAANVVNHHGSTGFSSRIQYPPAPQRSNISLPHIYDRPSPLVDSDQPLPAVPFIINLNPLLKWGLWRKLPYMDRTHRGHTFRSSDLLEPATWPHVRDLMIEVNHGDTKNWVQVRPRETDATFVSVLDVIQVAKDQIRSGVSGAFSNGEQSFRRDGDGTWVWRGLRVIEDQNDVCILRLDV